MSQSFDGPSSSDFAKCRNVKISLGLYEYVSKGLATDSFLKLSLDYLNIVQLCSVKTVP